MNRTIEALVLALALGAPLACAIGPRAAQFASTPEGVRATVTLPDVEFRAAELLEVGDSAVLLLTRGQELVRVYYIRMRSLVPSRGPAFFRGGWPRPAELERWRGLSRFPQGLPPSQLDTLLAHYGKQRVEVHR